ncbi:enolase C-terminal domain-like protein [Actinoplanes siamensis]|uniref:Mandelate racemase n=1 Tax=Actinoplanes siamensis TaxID=1223317 RepID=A0A919KBZ5_9ACTN|nr:enolase C-terminal domain-like protein [Actinoplanes siamensis]GIF02821.1 mandelate racemase [Actinoplanes siamensis]
MDVDVPVEVVTASAYRIPTDSPEADGTTAWTETTLVLVRARAAGRTGTGWTYGAAAAGVLVGDQLAGVVTGRDAMDVPACYDAMARATRNAGRPGIAACAISAVDVALWDLKARLLDIRLARLLGRARDTVPIYGSGGFTSYRDEQLTAQFTHWVREQGIPRVKMKIAEDRGAAENRDLARIAQARRIVGPDTELYVDANGGYGRKQAIRVARAAADQDVRWFEEPVSSDDLAGLREVRDSVTADVAAGEYGYDLPYFARMVRADAVDCLQADLSRCGGITEWQRVAAVAAAANLQISGHCAPHLHLDAAAATPNLRHLEWFHDHVRIEEMLFHPVAAPEPGGVLRPDPGRLGHGLEFRDDAASRYRIA